MIRQLPRTGLDSSSVIVIGTSAVLCIHVGVANERQRQHNSGHPQMLNTPKFFASQYCDEVGEEQCGTLEHLTYGYAGLHGLVST
jgi:hypothetical protein